MKMEYIYSPDGYVNLFNGDLFLLVALLLFLIGLCGVVVNLKNMVKIVLSLEIILLSINLNFVIFSVFLEDMTGQMFALFILTIAAAETSIGLALIVRLYKAKGFVKVDNFSNLKN